MKRIVVFVFSMLFAINNYTQANQFESVIKASGIVYNIPSKYNNEDVVYELFPTQNMWTFIKLNTRNGKMWQVQYDVSGSSRFETYLSSKSLVSKDKEVNGRFTLYPTQNIYTFILLDQLDGRTWQVQWSIESENRLIVPIN